MKYKNKVKRLKIRQSEYEKTVVMLESAHEPSDGYHKPGSLKK
jgi:hypothetical protein